MNKTLERKIKSNIRNTLQSTILNHMFEYTIYKDKNLTCEEIGEQYIKAMTELVNEYIEEQNLHLDYINRNRP